MAMEFVLKNIAEATDLDLRAAYQYYADGLIDITQRLKKAVEEKDIDFELTWYGSAAYRWGRLAEIHDEMEKRAFLTNGNRT